jgi:hypothetical protein
MTSHLHRALFFVTTGDYASANTDDQRQIVTSIVYRATKINVVTDKKTSPFTSTMPFPGH